MKKFIQYIKEVRREMGKVTWPTREEVVGGTTLVIVLSLVMALIIFIFDSALTRIISLIFNI
jgi:preprotein translocase subunit SecE